MAPASERTPEQGRPRRLSVVAGVLGLALLASGFSGLTNEVLWQRSLKRFLGGSETLSATLVVLVFLGGLGVGAVAMGRRARRARDPLLWLAILEGVLGLVNLGVCGLLRSDLHHTALQLQGAAAGMGLPLPLLHALGAGLVLLLPCLLMGATIPLASEVCQRRLGQRDPRVLGLVFSVNTLGAMGGCVLGSTVLVPLWGMSLALVGAAALNLAAGVLLLVLRWALGESGTPPEAEARTSGRRPLWRASTEEVLAFGLGLCALAYEMLLLRLSVLVHEPQPATFAMVLTGFLLFWSVGAGLGSRGFPAPLGLMLLLTAVFSGLGLYSAAQLGAQELGSAGGILAFVLQHPSLFLPCLLFGFLFTRVTARAAWSWGEDVGRVYGWNTLGACAGILGMVALGYGLHLHLAMGAVVVLCLAVGAFYLDRELQLVFPFFTSAALAGLGAVFFTPKLVDTTTWGLSEAIDPHGDTRFFFGPSGVVGVGSDGSVYWDGLWHSQLTSKPGDQVDTNNWWMAVAPVLAHSTGEISHVGLVGLGTGITAGTLSKLGSVERVDAYEINHTLERVYAEYPAGTMGVAEDPKIQIHWQDARTGLALHDQRYDIITTAPLYLRQAGAGILNSVETYELLRSRLAPGGIVCVFSWGTDAQAFSLRQTAAQVFAHQQSVWGGYLLLLSEEPIDLSESAIADRMSQAGADPLWAEIAELAGPLGPAGLASVVDAPGYDWGDGSLASTDDRPLVEYPLYLAREVAERGIDPDGLALPPPGEWSHTFWLRKLQAEHER